VSPSLRPASLPVGERDVPRQVALEVFVGPGKVLPPVPARRRRPWNAPSLAHEQPTIPRSIGCGVWSSELFELYRCRATDETFEALVFDWDGTPSQIAGGRHRSAGTHRGSLLRGVHVFVVSGTHLENIDEQLQARPRGPGRLHLCCNRGSEVFEVTGDGPMLMSRRTRTPKRTPRWTERRREPSRCSGIGVSRPRWSPRG